MRENSYLYFLFAFKVKMSSILRQTGLKSSSLRHLYLFFVLILLATFFSISGCSSKKRNLQTDWEKKSDSVFTSLASTPNLQEGYKVYKKYGCILCHGGNGEKGIHNKNAQTGEEIPALTYVAEGYTLDELRQQIFKGAENIARKDSLGPLPPYRMPSWKGIMTERELDLLTEYLMSLMPKGEKEEW